MRRTLQLAILAVALAGLALPLSSAQAAFPYKFTLSGPGLQPATVEVWMANNAALLATMSNGLESATPGTPLLRSGITYRLDWWWGACWLGPKACTADPAGAEPFHTLYFVDLVSRRGYLKYVDRPGNLPEAISDRWLEMPAEFDLEMQKVLADHTSQDFMNLWITCRLTVTQDLQAGNAP